VAVFFGKTGTDSVGRRINQHQGWKLDAETCIQASEQKNRHTKNGPTFESPVTLEKADGHYTSTEETDKIKLEIPIQGLRNMAIVQAEGQEKQQDKGMGKIPAEPEGGFRQIHERRLLRDEME